MTLASARSRAVEWMEVEPDAATCRLVQSWLDANNDAELDAHFGAPLAFGTSGLRGVLGIGPARMNRVVVARATSALCFWLDSAVPDARARGVCIGRDARTQSDEFFHVACRAVRSLGFVLHVFVDPVATPVVAHAALRTGAAAALVITASHNPPEYNGLKVYGPDSALIVAPVDQLIARHMESSHTARIVGDVLRAHETDNALNDVAVRICSESHYVDDIVAQQGVRDEALGEPVRIAYTALHGVGERVTRQVLARSGYTRLESVIEQAEPDSRFPTVNFPNPEEHGACDRVLALAQRIDADVAFAHDPDADRLAVGAVDANGTWRLLSGNDVGLLLANDALARTKSTRVAVLSTVVSSPMLFPLAAHYGAHAEQTLTGHKWLQRRALDLRASGVDVVFAYEEALGYACTPIVRDKDGISALLAMTHIAQRARANGCSLGSLVDELHSRFGAVVDRSWSYRATSPHEVRAIESWMHDWRGTPPTAVGEFDVLRIVDFNAATSAHSTTADLLRLEFDERSYVCLRPSGTENTLKCYAYWSKDADRGEPIGAVRARANESMDRLQHAMNEAWLRAQRSST